MPILDQFGREIVPTRVSRLDPASVAKVQPGDRTVAPGITPERLARVLRQANQGDLEDFLILAEEMEERDPHFYSALQTRKLATVGAPVRLELDPVGRDVKKDEKTGKPKVSPDEQAIVDSVEANIVKASWFRPMLLDLMDALSKGFSVLKPTWVTTSKLWTYSEFEHVEPRCFQFDREKQKEIRLRDNSGEDRPLPAGLVVHYARLRSCVPARGGLARVAVVVWMFKTFTVNDWVTFAEVYGMPLRIGKYDPLTTSAEEKAQLRSVLAKIGHDAAALVPHSMDIEVDALNSRTGGSGDVFLQMAEYFDKQLSKAVLGQTMTSDDGASLSQAEVHERTGNKIFAADALHASNTITDAVVRPWVQFNFGENAPRIRVVLDLEPAEDLEKFTKATLPWVQAGLKVSASDVRDKLGMSEPKDEDDVLGGPPAPAVDPNKTGPDGKPLAPPIDPNKKPAKPAGKVAPNAAQIAAAALLSVNDAERLADEATEDWEEVMGPFRETLEAIGAESASYDEFLAKLTKHYANRVDSNAFVKRLATEMARIHALAGSGQ